MRSFLILALTVTFTLPLCAQAKPNQLYEAAVASQQSGDLPSAIAQYRALLELRPNFIEARVGLGAALAQHAEYDAAIYQLNTALALSKNKRQPDMLLALGMAYQKKGDYQRARNEFQAVLDLQPPNTKPKKIIPDTIQAATLIGQCDLKLDDPAAALAAMNPRAYLADQNIDFARTLAIAMIRTGKFHDGAGILRRVADSGNTPDLFLITGAVSLQNDESEDARRDLETVRRVDPQLPGVNSLLGLDRFRAGDPFAAEASFREALRTQPDDFIANLYLGIILLQRKDLPAAKPFLDHALKLEPATPPTLAEIGITFSASAQIDPAIEALRKLSTENPAMLEPHLILAGLYDKLQRPTEAEGERKLIASLP